MMERMVHHDAAIALRGVPNIEVRFDKREVFRQAALLDVAPRPVKLRPREIDQAEDKFIDPIATQ